MISNSLSSSFSIVILLWQSPSMKIVLVGRLLILPVVQLSIVVISAKSLKELATFEPIKPQAPVTKILIT